MDKLESLALQFYDISLTSLRGAFNLARNGDWQALIGIAVAGYLALYAFARMARTAIWTVKWATIIFAILAAVGWADSGWKGQPPAGMRGVDYWAHQGQKAVAGGTGIPLFDSVLGAKPKRGPDEAAWQYAYLAKRAGRAYFGHGFQTVYDLANQGFGKLAEAAQDPKPDKKRKR